MANITKQKRDEMLAFLEQLKADHNDDASIRAFNEIQNHLTEKKFGLVFEEHTEEVDEKLLTHIPVLCADKDRRLCKDESKPWNFIIQGDNLQALYLLEKTHRGKVDCIYIDPPYNTGARDWKYNNDYVDGQDVYRHSKWLSMMKNRLLLAKHLLNPRNSVLLVTIDEKEFLHLGCLLEELFPTAKIQMISTVINSGGAAREQQFFRTDEYIFVVEIGNAYPQPLPLGDEWAVKCDKRTNQVSWRMSLVRGGSNATPSHSPGCFYPIFVAEDGSHIVSIGEPLPKGQEKESVVAPKGTIAIWPMRTDGSAGVWQMSPSTLKEAVENGYVRLGRFTKYGMAISYLNRKEVEKVKSSGVKILGRRPDGSLITDDSNFVREYVPGTQWRIDSHNARIGGTNILKQILGYNVFSYPKSVYAVHDVLRFFINNKPNAIIVDFFAGSGTTLHAVNLLNAADGGNRTCIMVTNNEISEAEEKEFSKKGIQKGDDEWEKKGIAQYVTWPRTVCSMNGVDINGNALKGNYIGSDRPMAEGFVANVKFFKCDWTPRKPEDYLLSNALCLHIREMIELQNHIEIDNKKYVLILNKSDFNKYVMDPEAYEQIEQIWVNQSIVLNSEELKLLRAKGFKYIPREYFGQELREAAE